MSNNDVTVGGIILFIFLIGIYFIPGVVAGARNCKSSGGIRVLNIFLGWSLIGWILSLIWALSGEVEEKKDK